MFSIRFKCYEAWTKQLGKCGNCDEHIHAQEIYEKCLYDDILICHECYMRVPTGEAQL